MDDIAKKVARRALGAVSRPAAKGNPAYEALSDAWTLYERKFKWDMDHAIGMLEVFSDDQAANRAGSKLDRSLQTLVKKAKSWAFAFNMLLEGRDVDVPKMIQDLTDTTKSIDLLRRNLSDAKRKYPVDDERVLDLGLASAKETLAAFDKAIKLLNKVKTASMEDRVASAYLEAQGE